MSYIDPLHVAGDVVGPGFFEDHLTAENQLHKPFGSCEQALYNFGVNLYYLKFLKTTDQLNKTVLAIALDHMNLGEDATLLLHFESLFN